MPFPAFLTQIKVDAGLTVSVSGGSGGSVSIPDTAYYYLLTNKTSAGDGRSFLSMLGTLLSTADGTLTYTCVLTSSFCVRITHNGGGTATITLPVSVSVGLGLVPEGTAPGGLTVNPGATGRTATVPPLWFWTPDMSISDTGPRRFDPAVGYGVPTSAGSAFRAPDMTTAYVTNGEPQYEADFFFNGVNPYYKAWPPALTTAGDANANKNFSEWWRYGPRLGRRVLFWRDRSQLVGTSAPEVGSTPFRYVEYAPKPELRDAPLISEISPGNLVHWDIRLPFWVTERGSGVFT